ncbi:hypothetical protein BJ965_000726 [Streptomyces luteogriseus]|uniref:Transposase IS701-like DDE domain-containing protein n=1 Tax=Streptomyces luteogriseus TaxID=68233 RepID=A0A7W7DHC4_9ACTN|nr:hypothetical protein [Streptomyces luteogriseus]
MQHLLGRAKWDADQVRDEVGDYVVEHLHDDEAVLAVDETGDVLACSSPRPSPLLSPGLFPDRSRTRLTTATTPFHHHSTNHIVE